MAIVPLFIAVFSCALGLLGLAAGITKAIAAADDGTGYSLVIVGIVAGIMGLFVALVQVYQWERLQANFFFMTNHYWGLGLMLTIIGLLVFDRPHLTFNFVAGIILMFFGLVISTLGICHLKPEPII